MKTRIAINGFGRIGRLVTRLLMKQDEIELVAINDLSDTATLAHLLKYDSVHREFDLNLNYDSDHLYINGKSILVNAERNPELQPWKSLSIDIVIESSGAFTRRSDIYKHVLAGAKRVLLTVPAKDTIDRTIVFSVNEHDLKPEDIIVSNASCTTNCLAPLVKIIHENFRIRNGLMTTAHAFTNDQRLVDSAHNDLRRARAASVNIIPSSTGAAKAVGLVIPELKGKLNGLALRVPVITGSIIDFTANLENSVTVDRLNEAVKEACEKPPYKGIVHYCQDPIVSSDIIASPYSTLFDSLLTQVMDETMIKVFAWYDNEWGYANRVVDLLTLMAKQN